MAPTVISRALRARPQFAGPTLRSRDNRRMSGQIFQQRFHQRAWASIPKLGRHEWAALSRYAMGRRRFLDAQTGINHGDQLPVDLARSWYSAGSPLTPTACQRDSLRRRMRRGHFTGIMSPPSRRRWHPAMRRGWIREIPFTGPRRWSTEPAIDAQGVDAGPRRSAMPSGTAARPDEAKPLSPGPRGTVRTSPQFVPHTPNRPNTLPTPHQLASPDARQHHR